MSAEALRFLASSHGSSPSVHQHPHGPFLSPGQQPRAPDGVGQGVPQALPPMPPPPGHMMDHFRALPPGLPPMGFYPPGFGNPSLALDMKNDPLSNALAHGQPIFPPPFYYDPCFSSAYPYHDRFGGHLDINGARRKNATRETTAALKAWLYEHRKNPYPTKGEKIMLAIITKMTLTQVSTWFANARRRLKKENKMTWSPRNRSGEDDDDDDDDDRNDEPNQTGADSSERPLSSQSSLLDMHDVDGSDNEANEKATHPGQITTPSTTSGKIGEHSDTHHRHLTYSSCSTTRHSDYTTERQAEKRKTGDDTSATLLSDQHLTSPSKKPKIWSIADTVNLPADDSSKKVPPEQPSGRTMSSVGATPHSIDAKPGPLMTSSAGPFNFTFPPFPQMAAMFPRAVHLAGLGQLLGGGGQSQQQQVQPVPPFFGLSPTAMMMVPRPELFYRNFLPLQQAPLNLAGLMQFGSVGVNPFNFYQPPAGTGSTCTGLKPTPAQQPAISSTSAVVSPISSANSTQSSSPNQNMTTEHRNQSK